MKVIFLEAVQNYGGARISTIELAARMRDLGHDVLVVDFWGYNKAFMDAIERYNLNIEVLDSGSEPYIISDKSKVKYLIKGINYFFIQNKLRRRMKKIIETFQPDVINVNNQKCMNILKPNNKDYRIDYFARGWSSFRSLSKRDIKRYGKYKPNFLTVSQSTRQAIYTGGLANLENIRVFTDVIDKKVFDSYLPEYNKFDSSNPIKILHSGGFLYTKGQHICVEIAKSLKEKQISFEMTLTGIIYQGGESEKYYQSVVRQIEEYDLSSNIKIILNKSNVIEYFEDTDVLIHPSWTEGLPRVCLEALSFGKPVIANPAGGVTDVVIHNLTGFITDFNNVQQYVEYVEKYYNDLDLYKSHSISARQLIEQNYLDKNQEENILRIYPI